MTAVAADAAGLVGATINAGCYVTQDYIDATYPSGTFAPGDLYTDPTTGFILDPDGGPLQATSRSPTT